MRIKGVVQNLTENIKFDPINLEKIVSPKKRVWEGSMIIISQIMNAISKDFKKWSAYLIFLKQRRDLKVQS